MHENFKPLMASIKNCMDDDWQNDIRFASVILLKGLLNFLGSVLEYEDFKDIYPEMLKRLDDAQDGIRIEMCNCFEVFFEILPTNWSSSLYEYCIKTIFIHLDDNNENIQKAVVSVLKKASRILTQEFVKVAREMEGKSSHPALCQALLDYATDTEHITD